MTPVPLDYIAFIADKPGGARTLRSVLQSPDAVFWNDTDSAAFSRCFERIQKALAAAPPLIALLKVHLVAHALLHGKAAPDWYKGWLTERLAGDGTLPVPLDAAAGGSWRAVAVPLAGGREAGFVATFVAGWTPGLPDGVGWPRWADPLMAPETKQAFAAALQAAAEPAEAAGDTAAGGFRVFPLAPPNGTRQFKGRSLGLPAALAFRAIRRNRPLPQAVVATGVIRPDGAVTAVGFADQKAAAAASGFQAFLYPAENGRLHQGGAMALYPVRSLDQAWMVSQLHGSGDPERLHLLASMLADGVVFVRNLHAVPPAWLRWCRENGYLVPAMQAIRSAPPLFAALADRLETAVFAGRTEAAETAAMLVDPELDFPALADAAPLAAFRWAGLNLCMKNRRGRPDEAGFWSGKARNLLDKALKADMHMVSDFFNFEFVARHNRFDFRPEPPEGMKRLLAVLESQYAHQQAFGCPTHLVLGRIYGTMTQNFGFCGPDFLADTRNCAAKARRALGEDAVPEYRDEWLRQYNYLAYALLDAGDRAGARQTLFRYFGIADWDALPGRLPGFTPWQHALAARFFGDTADAAGGAYYEWCRKHFATPPPEHPWQLWCFNMGRVAAALDRPAEAVDWFRQSLDRCGADRFGPTVRVMALLPLAALNAMDAPAEDARHHETRIRRVAQSLNPDYFRALLTMDFSEILAAVDANPARWFPFSYR